MSSYGEYVLLSGGSLSDPELNALARAEATSAYEAIAASGVNLGPIEFIECRDRPVHKPSRRSLEEAGLAEEDIAETLAWAETVEWPRYEDSLGWRAVEIP